MSGNVPMLGATQRVPPSRKGECMFVQKKRNDPRRLSCGKIKRQTTLKRIGETTACVLGFLGVLVMLGALGGFEVGELDGLGTLWRCICGAAVIGGGCLLQRLTDKIDRRPDGEGPAR